MELIGSLEVGQEEDLEETQFGQTILDHFPTNIARHEEGCCQVTSYGNEKK